MTTVTHERVNISDDGTHVGIYTVAFDVSPSDEETEATVTGTFRYFDSSGKLWEVAAPSGAGFYLPVNTNQRLFTPDGSRVLMISTDQGNTDPVVTVYDKNGTVLYQTSGAFVELSQAQISPNGQYLLVMGIVKSNKTYGHLIRVTEISTNISSDFPFDIVTGGRPVISISSDGRFLLSYQGSQVVSPP